MSKHTPGSWHLILDDTGGPFTGWPSVSAAEELDCTIVHRAGFKQEFWGELSQQEAIANARLIAAAPDLLEALRQVVAVYDGNHVGAIVGMSFDKARAAIAKAEGKQ